MPCAKVGHKKKCHKATSYSRSPTKKENKRGKITELTNQRWTINHTGRANLYRQCLLNALINIFSKYINDLTMNTNSYLGPLLDMNS